jgi:polyferredoxin
MSMIWEIVGDILRISALATLGIAGILTVSIWKENLRTRVTYIRLIVQAVAFAVTFYLFSKSIPLFYFLILFPITIIVGRLYCGWFCSFGFIMDIVALIKRKFKKSYRVLPDKLNKSLHKLRYVILLFILLLPTLLWWIDPPPNLDFAVLMLQFLSGPFRPYTFLIDPMIPLVVPWITPFSFNTIYFNYPYAQNIVTYVSGDVGLAITSIFVILTLVGSLLFRRVWCRFCPTGSSLAIVNRFKGFKWAPLIYVEKDEEKCKDCEVCEIACPTQVNELYEQKNGKIYSSKCILCACCVESCPHPDAIKLNLSRKSLFKSRNSAWRIPRSVRKLFRRS